MSVGGRVIETIDCGDKVWVNTKERYWNGSKWKLGDQCAIYVERNDNSLRIRFNDSLWWQGGKAYWTARDGSNKEDTPIPRIGFSGVPRPAHSVQEQG